MDWKHFAADVSQSFIFVFYLVFVLTIMYYFLHGMVAKDGICDGKRDLDAARSNIIDDCIINSAMFENYSHTSAKRIYDTSTSAIEAALKAIETLPKRVRRATTTKPSFAENFERFHINKTIIQDIYVEMLKVAVYAPKNIEPFALIWHANRLSKAKALQELNCTHAIGHTMAVSLHGQVASEMDKLYRSTWRVEALLQDLPTQLKAKTDDTADFDGITELTKNLRAIFNAGKEPLRRSISHTASAKGTNCKSVAQLYKSLKTPACECLVPSMNLYWFGAFVAICLLLLLLALILCLEEMIRRSASSNRESRSRLKLSKSHHSHRGRGSSRTRSSSRPGTKHSTRSNTSYSTRNNTPYSTRAGTPNSTRPNSPYSNRLDTPYSSHAATPYSTRATTPYSSHPDTPYTSRSNTPHSSRRVTPYTSRHVSPYAGTPHTTRARSKDRTPTRGTSLALKHPPENAPYLVDYRRFGVDDPFVEQFTERLSRRDMLPRHLQRQQQQQPSQGQHDVKDNFTFESYPDMPAKLQQARSLERKPDRRKEPRNVWKNEAFRYPGPGGSDISTMLQCFRGPRSISKTLEQRGRSQPSERTANVHHKEPTLIAQRSTNETLVDGPTTSGAIPKIKLPPGKVGIVVCPCGCGKPSKIYGTKQDIERIRKAGKVCIAKRGQQFKDRRLRPLASVVELRGTEEGNEDVA
uniref:Prominin-like protein n=1 Tax=Bactrocera latifrons TaxID=174628 RepID=A0A0K8UMF9_BACLA